ncbi:MAG: M15 family metallopeptidase [Treponema sp.]|nr:M15 family metallopeptidase [Treponema sp.]
MSNDYTKQTAQAADFTGLLSTVLQNARLPETLSCNIREGASENPAFILDLFTVLQGDPLLRLLVDKEHPLPKNYEPDDLVELKGVSYRSGRAGLSLRSAAEASLEEMAAAAKTGGVTLTASSAYRSYAYQTQVYERNVREMGQQAADRESARPGCSQHQLGLVVDFGSIDDSFAQTRESRWLAANASRFGWSLSYPEGYEDVTGYRWESWHYRYMGKELAEFINSYFGGIQQYALLFIREWEQLPDG